MKKISELLIAEYYSRFEGGRYSYVTLDSITKSWEKGQSLKKDEIHPGGENACIHYGELFTKYGKIIDAVYSQTNSQKISSSKCGDILFPASDVTPNGLARCSVITVEDVLLGGDIIIMRPNEGINPVYLSYAINYQKNQLLSRVTGSAIMHISAKKLQSVTIPLPPIELQNEFELVTRKCEVLRGKIKQAEADTTGCIKTLIK